MSALAVRLAANLAAEQGAGAEEGARGLVAATVELTSQQRAGGAADDQAGGAARAAVAAAIVVKTKEPGDLAAARLQSGGMKFGL